MVVHPLGHPVPLLGVCGNSTGAEGQRERLHAMKPLQAAKIQKSAARNNLLADVLGFFRVG